MILHAFLLPVSIALSFVFVLVSCVVSEVTIKNQSLINLGLQVHAKKISGNICLMAMALQGCEG